MKAISCLPSILVACTLGQGQNLLRSLENVIPAPGATNVARNTAIAFRFNSRIDASRLALTLRPEGAQVQRYPPNWEVSPRMRQERMQHGGPFNRWQPRQTTLQKFPPMACHLDSHSGQASSLTPRVRACSRSTRLSILRDSIRRAGSSSSSMSPWSVHPPGCSRMAVGIV